MMPYRNSKRIGGEQISFLVENFGANDNAIFRTTEDYKRFVSLIAQQSRKNHSIGVVAYALTQKSMHLVVQESERGAVAKFIHRLSVAYVMYFHSKYATSGKLFKGPYKDTVLTHPEDVIKRVCHVHKLPQNVVKNIEAYEWSSYKKYLSNQAPWLHKAPIADFFSTPNPSFELRQFTNNFSG
jgi:hypothetical protein